MNSDVFLEILGQKDTEIRVLRMVVESLTHAYAEMYGEHGKGVAYESAMNTLREVYNEHGLRSDGRMR